MKILITGATGGIGYAVTDYLAKQGIEIFACDLNEKQFNYPNVKFIKTDVTSKESLNSLYNKLLKEKIELDAIITFAGIFIIDSFIEANDNKLKTIFDVNFLGVISTIKTIHPLLKRNGRIVITTSDVATLSPLPFNGIYSVSKTALESYAQALRQEINLLGQKVITVRPGAFDTNLSKGSLVKTKELQEKTQLYKEQSQKFYKLVKSFMGKPKNPEKLVKLYYKTITKKRVRLSYNPNANVLLHLLGVLPKKFQCCIIKFILKPKKSK